MAEYFYCRGEINGVVVFLLLSDQSRNRKTFRAFLTAEDIWFRCNLPQRFIPQHKCIDLKLHIFKMFVRAVFEIIGKGTGIWGWKKIKVKKIRCPTLSLCLMVIFLLEMGQNQQLTLKNWFLVDFFWFLSRYCWFWPISCWKMAIRHKNKVEYLIFLHFDFPQNPDPWPWDLHWSQWSTKH